MRVWSPAATFNVLADHLLAVTTDLIELVDMWPRIGARYAARGWQASNVADEN